MRDHKFYLRDIFDAMNAIESFVEQMDFNQFKRDDKTSSAVIRKLEIVGEATKNIPEKTIQKYSDVPWKEMAGMRDKLIRFYFGVNYRLIWKTIKNRIPQVRPIIQRILNESDG